MEVSMRTRAPPLKRLTLREVERLGIDSKKGGNAGFNTNWFIDYFRPSKVLTVKLILKLIFNYKKNG